MLYKCLEDLVKDDWAYYKNIDFENFSQAMQNPSDFIHAYFACGRKENLLFDTIAELERNKDNPIYEKRRIHIISTFFLGAYLYKNIPMLHCNNFAIRPGQNDNEYGSDFLWAWFLCALYHDCSYNYEREEQYDLKPNFLYADWSEGLLYRKEILKNYFWKEKNENTSHDGKSHIDHGIAAAESLHNSYLKFVLNKLLDESERKREDEIGIEKLEDFVSGAEVEICDKKLTVSLRAYHAVCKIAKIIACHNIYACTEGGEQRRRYENSDLSELINVYNNPKFRHMPCTKKNGSIGKYEKLYFLLVLVDTLEPTKREIDLNNIDICVCQYGADWCYKICIEYNGNDAERYFAGIKSLESWVNFVSVSDDGHEIIIDFHKDKNRQKEFLWSNI